MDKELRQHYINQFGAVSVGIIHPYHFVIPEESAREIRGVYMNGKEEYNSKEAKRKDMLSAFIKEINVQS
jgi:hypothetical protein